MLFQTLEKIITPEFIKQGLMKDIHGDIGVDLNGELIRPDAN